MLVHEDVHIDIGLAGIFNGIFHFEAMPGSYGESGQQQVNVGRAVGAAELNGLLAGMVVFHGAFLRVGLVYHIFLARPSERYPHQHRTVAVAPTDVGWRFLVWHQPEV